jgi:hypothetical protein
LAGGDEVAGFGFFRRLGGVTIQAGVAGPDGVGGEGAGFVETDGPEPLIESHGGQFSYCPREVDLGLGLGAGGAFLVTQMMVKITSSRAMIRMIRALVTGWICVFLDQKRARIVRI